MDNVLNWLLGPVWQLIPIVIGAFLLRKLIIMVTKKIVKKSLALDHESAPGAHELREKTIISVVTSIITVAVLAVATVMILSALGVNTAPLIAGAGVFGIAIGFGAQDFVRDFIAGMFIIIENQYRVGDVVAMNGVGGKVESITMRMTTLRDLDGNVHHIANGNIDIVTNKTMDFSKINMNIGVGYSSDIDKVEVVINTIGSKLAKDKDFKDDILEAPYFLRIARFSDSSVEIKIMGKTLPTRQWAVAGELRKRLKVAFEKEGIEIPFPQIVVHRNK